MVERDTDGAFADSNCTFELVVDEIPPIELEPVITTCVDEGNNEIGFIVPVIESEGVEFNVSPYK
jgi:hypothetical protein